METRGSQAAFFRDMGYLRVPGVVDSALATKLHEFIKTEYEQEATQRNIAKTAFKLYGLYDRSPDLINQVARHPMIVPVLQSLLGPHIVMTKNRHNHASLNLPGQNENRLHRDILQPTRGLVTALFYLEESTPESGCTYLIPGSHRLPFVGVPQPDGGGTWMDEHNEYNGLDDQALALPAKPGDVLLFDGLVFHTAGDNSSINSRASITLGYRSVDELEAQPDMSRLVLVSGETIYRGNDRP